MRFELTLELRDDLALFCEKLSVLSNTVSVSSQDLAAHFKKLISRVPLVRVVSRDVLALSSSLLRPTMDFSSILLGYSSPRSVELRDT